METYCVANFVAFALGAQEAYFLRLFLTVSDRQLWQWRGAATTARAGGVIALGMCLFECSGASRSLARPRRAREEHAPAVEEGLQF